MPKIDRQKQVMDILQRRKPEKLSAEQIAKEIGPISRQNVAAILYRMHRDKKIKKKITFGIVDTHSFNDYRVHTQKLAVWYVED